MDPYLEGQVWSDFHHNFIIQIQAALVPRLRPRYVVRVEENVYLEYESDESRRIIRPDVTLFEVPSASETTSEGGVAVMTPPVAIPLPMPEQVREAYLEVRLRETHEVVTVIELLSPVNKRAHSESRREYLAKREAVLRSPVHLVEMDLLRGGERLPMARTLPPADYYVIVSRAPRRPMADVWAFTLRHRLPTIPVPLADEDPDVPLDLQEAFNAVYDRAGYDYSVDYQHGTIPPLRGDEAAWAQAVVTPSSSEADRRS
jgi:hypothetical protein